MSISSVVFSPQVVPSSNSGNQAAIRGNVKKSTAEVLSEVVSELNGARGRFQLLRWSNPLERAKSQSNVWTITDSLRNRDVNIRLSDKALTLTEDGLGTVIPLKGLSAEQKAEAQRAAVFAHLNRSGGLDSFNP